MAIWAALGGRSRTHRIAMTLNAIGLFVAVLAAFTPGRFLSGLLFG